METVSSFAVRVRRFTGLELSELPDAPDDVMLGGSIVCRRGGTAIVLVDLDHQDEEGNDVYRRAVLCGRAADLPAARDGATGDIPIATEPPVLLSAFAADGESLEAAARRALEQGHRLAFDVPDDETGGEPAPTPSTLGAVPPHLCVVVVQRAGRW